MTNYNLVRIEGLRMWFNPSGEEDEDELKLRMAEIVFNHASFMARLYCQMPGITEFDKIISN